MKMKLTWLLAGIAALVLHAGTAAAAEVSPAHIPEECQQPNLSKEVQRFCDQLQFADVPHYHVVRLASNGAVRSIRLLDTVTGREVFTSYPYGIKFAIADQEDSELRIRTEELEETLNGRPTPAEPGPAQPAPASYATGLPIGWNSSTGATSGTCLNYTIAPLSGKAERLSFSSENTASSTAEQINVSATVSAAFDFLTISDTATFSDQWQSSTNSSNQYFNAFSLYTLNTTVPESDPLNEEGQTHLENGDFNTICGTDYLATVPVGMVVTLSINYGSTSSSTQTSISNVFNVNVDLVDSLSTAVETATQDTNSSSYFTFVLTAYGGGTDASADLQGAFTQVVQEGPNQGQAFYALCAQGNAPACTQFTSNMGQGIIQALGSVDRQVTALNNALNSNSATNPDLSFLQSFPKGVAGANIAPANSTAVPPLSSPTSDVLIPYQSKLLEVVTLLNQIGTLKNRVVLMQGLLNQSDFNPAGLLDLVGVYLDPLQNIYDSDRAHLSGILRTCLSATSANVTSACQPILANQADNAFEYYAAGGPRPNFFAQQNTLALQYTGQDQVVSAIPLDVLYIDELPSLGGIPIAGEAALVSFVDRPTPNPSGGFFSDPHVDILALEPNEPLSTNNVSTKVRANPAEPSPFTFWRIFVGNIGTELGPSTGTNFTSVSCTPTFTQPCAINYLATGEPGRTVEHRQIEGLFPAD